MNQIYAVERNLFKLGDGGVDGAGGPGGRFGDEAVEEGLGGGADVVAALGVPLDAEDEVVRGGVRGLTAFDGFDDGVLRAAGGDAEAVAGNANGLVVAGVDGETEETVLLGGFFGDSLWSLFRGNDGSEEGIRSYGGSVGDGYAAASRVVDRQDAEVLDQGSSAPDVERLEAEADGEDGLIEVVGVLNEEFVDVFPGVVGGRALGDGVLAVFVGIDVGWAAGEEDRLAGVDEVSDLGGGGFEGDLDGLAAAAGNGFGVHGPGALVVGEVRAGGDGDGYAGVHKAGKRDEGRGKRKHGFGKSALIVS
jgi:hypothetical protein